MFNDRFTNRSLSMHARVLHLSKLHKLLVKACICTVIMLNLMHLGNVQEASRLLGCKDVRVNCLDEVTKHFW